MKKSILVCLIAAALGGACTQHSEDCEVNEPDSAKAMFSTSVGTKAKQGESYSVWVQLLLDYGLICNDDFEGCHCDDAPPGVVEFEIVDAACDDGSCIVTSVGPYVVYTREIRIVPQAGVVRLRVLAADSSSAQRLETSETFTLSAE